MELSGSNMDVVKGNETVVKGAFVAATAQRRLPEMELSAAQLHAGERATAVPPITGLAPWLMPTIGNVCSWLLLFLLIMYGRSFLVDSDTGWHIRTGDLIRQTRQVPQQDPFSHSMAGQPWFAWEWLSDVTMSVLHSTWGLSGVVAVSMLLLGLTYTLMYQRAMQLGADPLVTSGLTLLGAMLSVMHWLARPHIVSLLLMAIWIWLFEAYRLRRARWIYAAPLLIALWVNLHGAFFITFPLVAIYLCGEWLEHGLRGEWWSGRVRQMSGTYILVGVASFFATLLNPYGVRLYPHLVGYVSDSALLAQISEFQPISFHTPEGKFFEVFLLLTAAAAFLCWRQRKLVELGLILLWVHLALQSARHVLLAAVVLIPLQAALLSQALNATWAMSANEPHGLARLSGKLFAWYQGMLSIDRQLKGTGIYLATFVLLFTTLMLGKGKQWVPQQFSGKNFPVEAANFVEQAQPAGTLPGNVYSSDQYGGYLIYRFAGRVKVFIDGRSDFYKQGAVLTDYDRIGMLKPDWHEKLVKYNVGWLLLRRDEPLALLAQASGQWVTVHQDTTAQVLARKASP